LTSIVLCLPCGSDWSMQRKRGTAINSKSGRFGTIQPHSHAPFSTGSQDQIVSISVPRAGGYLSPPFREP
jgi:hypothetical protein